jgi:hypothetical protein
MIGVLKSLRENSLTTQTHVFADFLLTNADAHESFSRFLLFFYRSRSRVEVLRLDDDLSIDNLLRHVEEENYSVCRLPAER